MRCVPSFSLFGVSCMALPTARNFLLRGSFLSSTARKQSAVVRAVSASQSDAFSEADICDTGESTYSTSVDHTQRFESTSEETEILNRFQNTNTDDADAVRSIPFNFGAPDGPEISNKETVLRDVDKAVSHGRPPDIEVLLADHLCYTGNSFMKAAHLTLLRYGHVAVRYTTKDGTEQIMNILGGDALALPGASMVNFVKPSEYLYGTSGFDTFAQQGGVYNRDFVGVRIERVSEGAIEALHSYYTALQVRSAIESKPSEATSIGSRVSDKASKEEQNAASKMGPGGRGRGAARFELTSGRLRSFLVQLGVPESAELVQSLIVDAQKQVKSWLHRSVSRPVRTEATKHKARTQNDTSNNDPGWLTNAASDAASRAAEASAKMSNKATEAAHRAATGAADAAEDARKVVWREATHMVQTGNCAQWTSEGLTFAGLLPSSRSFPKSILILLLESEMRRGRSENIKVVVYSEVKHAQKAWPNHRFLAPAYVHPLHWMSNVVYSNMREYADAVVEVPPGEVTAIVKIPELAPRRPPDWLQLWQSLVVFTPPAVMLGLVGQIGPFGPAAAAGWLALNWWLQ